MSTHHEALEPRRLFSSPTLETFTFGDLPSIGSTPAGQEMHLGGFSGLVYEGQAKNGNLQFITITDRGPSGQLPGGLRVFLIPDYSPRLVRFELDPATGETTITEQILLEDKNGDPITGRSNIVIPGASANAPYNDEVPADVFGNLLPLDPLGGDYEGLSIDPKDGSFWLVDEYRVSIYHFHKNGRLKERFVPQGTAAAAGMPEGTYGTEALPAVFAQRRTNRGFEGVAAQDGKVYAFVQSPLRNPTNLSNANLDALRNIRVLELDPKTLQTRQFIYVLDNANLGPNPNNRADKVGDVTAIGGGEFLLMERDTDTITTDPVDTIEKKIYRFDLAGATDVSDLPNTFTVIRGGNPVQVTLDQMTPAELVAAGVQPIEKSLHVDLAAVGYNRVTNAEGLAYIDDSTIAVINDNDFTIPEITIDPVTGLFTRLAQPDPVLLGIIRTAPATRDGAPSSFNADFVIKATGEPDDSSVLGGNDTSVLNGVDPDVL